MSTSKSHTVCIMSANYLIISLLYRTYRSAIRTLYKMCLTLHRCLYISVTRKHAPGMPGGVC